MRIVYGTRLRAKICDGTAEFLVLLLLSMEISIIAAYSGEKKAKTSLLVTLGIMFVMLLSTSTSPVLMKVIFKYYVSLVSDYIDANVTALSMSCSELTLSSIFSFSDLHSGLIDSLTR